MKFKFRTLFFFSKTELSMRIDVLTHTHFADNKPERPKMLNDLPRDTELISTESQRFWSQGGGGRGCWGSLQPIKEKQKKIYACPINSDSLFFKYHTFFFIKANETVKRTVYFHRKLLRFCGNTLHWSLN